MTAPTFDANGYPTDETLQTLRCWDVTDPHGAFEFMRQAWKYDEYFVRTDNNYAISTVGWSGNEDLIGAFQENAVLWSVCWESSRKGGHYEFAVPDMFQQTPLERDPPPAA